MVKGMMLPLTPCGSRNNARIKVLLWTQLVIFVSTEQQAGVTKKSPIDLMCYQNYTLKDNFCFCSWKPGEESQNATYILNYSTYDGDNDDSFPAGHQTYYITDSSEMHFKKPIYVWVEAHEDDKIYDSEKITVLLDKAVKLDPPDLKHLSMEKHGRSVTINWRRIDRFSQSIKTRREIQYTVEEHPFVTVPCNIYETRNTPNCDLIENEETKLPICKESCTFNLDGDKERYIQIRQKYEESVWSEWSHSVFIPADIDYNLHASYKERKLENNGIRTLRLDWKPGRENQGDINYNITLTLLPCPDAKLQKSTKYNWLYTVISDASYNVTVVAFNQAEKTPPWTVMIDDNKNIRGSEFDNVTLSERKLTMKWKKKTKKPATYCIEWQSSAENGSSFSNITRNIKSNHLSIPTDQFKSMQCYRIRIHTFNNSQHSTVGTAYYFQPLMNIGPGNLTVVNVTSQSVLLQWNDLQTCQVLLKNWEITITDHNTNTSRREISNETRHLVEHLSLGFRCTFEVRGVTIYGEYTGRSVTQVFIPSTAVLLDTGTNSKWLPLVVLPICLITGIVICVARTRLRMYLCPLLPDPSKSNVTTFVPNDSNYILCPKYLIDSSSENRQTDSLEIEPKVVLKDTNMIFKEPDIKQVARTSGIFDNEIFVVSEADSDLQFAYKKQVVAVTPGTANEALIQEIRKLKDDDLGTEADLQENVTLLSVCEDAICV